MDRTLQTANREHCSYFLLAAPKLEQPDLLHGAVQALHHLKQEKKKTLKKHKVQQNALITSPLTTQLFPSHMQLDLFLLFMLQLLLTKLVFFTQSLTAFTAFLTEVVLKLL